ncbi:hypothetical protein ACQP3C_29055, partial [Escherichia coli]
HWSSFPLHNPQSFQLFLYITAALKAFFLPFLADFHNGILGLGEFCCCFLFYLFIFYSVPVH